ncbi:hypothetical protein IDM40_13480 [Nocardiopsis sp. HNM0947]|uniref:Uncharacterized protein n=1 Tax=Nocardiopsis coralli TaxID=2772213 RepID=A0ABR9P794_9ACTN|nr:hypothetical protein [Nocardiopsis coralli]MBE2999713.1 hypothetical protein [Nocardiopsis coralli]
MRPSEPPVSAYLPLRYVLTDTVAVRTRRDPLHVDTDPALPGRAQRGMLAAALQNAGRHDALHTLVARGDRLRFAPAHPRLEPGETEDGTPHPDTGTVRVAHPAPANLYTPGKDGTTLVDVFGPTDPSVPYKAVRDPLTPDRLLRARVRTTAERFLARPGTQTPGGPFHTTALDAGQVFEARWHLRGPDEGAVESLAHDVLDTLARADGTLTLGSGGTRAHGGVRVEPADPARPLSPDRARCPWPDRSVPAGGTVDLLLLSPALVVGAHGGPSPRSLVSEAVDLCRRTLPDAGVEPVTSHVEPELVGAYHRGYHGPMAQRWAAAPGSVVRLCTRGGLSTSQVRALEAHHLGERAVDGYGQFMLLPPPPEEPAPLPPVAAPVAGAVPGGTDPSAGPTSRAGMPAAAADARTPDPGTTGIPVSGTCATGVAAQATAEEATTVATPAPEPGPDWGPALRTLHDTLLWDAARPVVHTHARACARACAHRLAPLTPGLLEHLRATLTRPDRTPLSALADLARTVSGADRALSAKALRTLDRARPTGEPRTGPVTARAWLTLPSDPDGLFAWWADHRPRPGNDPDYAAALAAVDLDLADGHPPGPGELSARARAWEHRAAARLCRAHLLAWLTEAARLLRARGGVRP